MAIDILVSDYLVQSTTRVENAVRRVIEEFGPANVTVVLLPADRNGRWDLGLRHDRAWSLRTFDSAAEDLATRAATEVRHLCKALHRSA